MTDNHTPSLRGAAILALNALHECIVPKGAETQISDAMRALRSAIDSSAQPAATPRWKCSGCGDGSGWYTSYTTGYPHQLPCRFCNPTGAPKHSISQLESDPFLAASVMRNNAAPIAAQQDAANVGFVQSSEWGPMPEAGTQADYSQAAAIVEGDEASRVIRWNRGVSAFSYPVGTELYAVKPNYPGATVADRLDAMADDRIPGSQCQADLFAAATAWRKHLTGPAAQQDAADAGGEAEPDTECKESDGCPTEKAVLKRFWREHKNNHADAGRFRWLTEDHDSAEVREYRNDILRRMPVMSYSAACADIDAARATNQERQQ